MKFLKVKYYLILIFTILFFSCNKENRCDCFKGTGEITTEERVVTVFNKISLENNINLYITEDTVCSVKVEAGSHLLKSIKTEVTDSCLYLKNGNKCNWVRSYKDKINIYVKFIKIKGLMYKNASGNVYTTDTIHANYFQLDNFNGSGTINLIFSAHTTWFNLHTGPADLNATGTSGVCYLYSAGNGKADIRNLKTNIMFLNNKSTNECYVNVKDELEVKIGYVGDVYYTGDPTIIKEITGSGKLIKF